MMSNIRYLYTVLPNKSPSKIQHDSYAYNLLIYISHLCLDSLFNYTVHFHT